MKLLLLLTLPLYVLDQVTKILVQKFIGTEEVIPVIPGFLNLVHWHNTGAAFSMLRGNNSFFVILASVAMVVIGILFFRGFFKDRLSRVGAALLLAGVAGNLTDRIYLGHVVDFVDVILPWYGHWPAFNVADSCICIAAGLFILASFLEGKAPKEKPALRA